MNWQPSLNLMWKYLPVGKLPPELLAAILARAPILDRRIVMSPGIGLDCAVVDLGTTFLVFKTDPITFASDAIGWYAVQVNANDIATTGALPRWFLMTLLLPEDSTTPELVDQISDQVFEACRQMSVSVIGGHTEITYGLQRPILVGTMIGEAGKGELVRPDGAQPGDRLLLIKSIPIEATAILARELPDRLETVLTEGELRQAQDYLYEPGISVLHAARLAVQAGKVTAMHDPTEGGLASALWELAEAAGRTLVFDPQAVSIDHLAARVCGHFGIDPLAAIASGALLLTAAAEDAPRISSAIQREGMPCVEIGSVQEGPPVVWQTSQEGTSLLERPARDAIASLFE
jgi:hydrogenase maturation factor